VEEASFQLRLTGGTSDRHNFQGYDGYMSLAGFALTLSLVTNYVETGVIRHKGDFPGRGAVRAGALREGSVLADFAVLLHSTPSAVFGGAVATAGSAYLLQGLVSRVIARNLGQTTKEKNDAVKNLVAVKRGDVEALVAATEASIRQSHDVIGNGAKKIQISGGVNILNNYNAVSKRYVRSSQKDNTLLTSTVSVSGFYGNSGHGSVFDPGLGKNVSIGML